MNPFPYSNQKPPAPRMRRDKKDTMEVSDEARKLALDLDREIRNKTPVAVHWTDVEKKLLSIVGEQAAEIDRKQAEVEELTRQLAERSERERRLSRNYGV